MSAPMWMDMSEHTALDYGDPVLTTQEAGQMDAIVLERLASDANGPVKGKGCPRLELISYFGRQTTLIDYAE